MRWCGVKTLTLVLTRRRSNVVRPVNTWWLWKKCTRLLVIGVDLSSAKELDNGALFDI